MARRGSGRLRMINGYKTRPSQEFCSLKRKDCEQQRRASGESPHVDDLTRPVAHACARIARCAEESSSMRPFSCAGMRVIVSEASPKRVVTVQLRRRHKAHHDRRS